MEWKEYKNTGYMISNTGIVKSLYGNNIGYIDSLGFKIFQIREHKVHVARFVCLEFNGPHDDTNDFWDIKYIDGDKSNLNHTNLEWISRREKRSSGGDSWCVNSKVLGYYTAKLRVGGKTYLSGLYETKEDAKKGYRFLCEKHNVTNNNV
jgi:hypothetical protein